MFSHYESLKKNVFEVLPLTFAIEVASPTFSADLESFCSYFRKLEKAMAGQSKYALNSNRYSMNEFLGQFNKKT